MRREEKRREEQRREETRREEIVCRAHCEAKMTYLTLPYHPEEKRRGALIQKIVAPQKGG